MAELGFVELDRDHFEVCQSLKELESKQIRFLGGALGIGYSNLKKMKDLPSDMVAAWLRKEDDVLSKSGHPTWCSLVKCLREIGQNGIATNIEIAKLSAESTPLTASVESSAATAGTQPLPRDEATHLVSNTASTPVDRSDENEVSDISFPLLDVTRLSPDDKNLLEAELRRESQAIWKKFYDMLDVFCQSLSKRNIPVDNLVSFLRRLKAYGTMKEVPPEQQDSVFKEHMQQLQNATSIEDVFNVVEKYCSFFNYEIIENIIEKHGCASDKLKLQRYTEEFKLYARRRIHECPSHFSRGREESAVLCLKLDSKYDRYSLNDLGEFRISLSEILNISPRALLLCKVDKGCIELSFQIPTFIQHKAFPLTSHQEASLRDLGVLSVSAGDYRYSSDDHQEQSKVNSDFKNLPAGYLSKEISAHKGIKPETGNNIPEETSPKLKRETITRIRSRFIRLVGKIASKLMKEKIDTETFRLFLIELFSKNGVQCTYIPKTSSVFVMFEAISTNGLWDYSCHEDLLKIVERFGEKDPKLMHEIDVFKKVWSHYLTTERIEDYTDHCREFQLVRRHKSKKNIVVYGIPEETEHCRFYRLHSDLSKATTLMHSIVDELITIRDCYRLGRYNPHRHTPRPLLVRLSTRSEVEVILAKRSKLSQPYFVKPYISLVHSHAHPAVINYEFHSKEIHSNNAKSHGFNHSVVLHGMSEETEPFKLYRLELELRRASARILSVDKSIPQDSVKCCYRLGRYNPHSQNPRPLLVRLSRKSEVKSILSKSKQTKSNFIYPYMFPILLKERWSLILSGMEKTAIKISKNCLYIIHQTLGPTLHCILVDELQSNVDLFRVLELIRDVKNWRVLGSQLGLSTSKLDEVESKSDSIQEQKTHVMEAWFAMDLTPTWRKLSKALQAPAMIAEKTVAKKIETSLVGKGSSTPAIAIPQTEDKANHSSTVS